MAQHRASVYLYSPVLPSLRKCSPDASRAHLCGEFQRCSPLTWVNPRGSNGGLQSDHEPQLRPDTANKVSLSAVGTRCLGKELPVGLDALAQPLNVGARPGPMDHRGLSLVWLTGAAGSGSVSAKWGSGS